MCGARDEVIFLPAPRFSSLMAPSAAFCHGEYGSVCLKWHPISLAFFLNVPIACSLALSMTIVIGTPSRAAIVDKPSCASDFFCMGNTRTQQYLVANTCAYLFLRCHDGSAASNVSVNMSQGKRLYLSCLSFVLNLLCNVSCNTDLTPCCVVASMVLRAASSDTFHRCANCIALTFPPSPVVPIDGMLACMQ